MADGLYVSQKVIQVCKDYGWDYIICYKEGYAIHSKRICGIAGERKSNRVCMDYQYPD